LKDLELLLWSPDFFFSLVTWISRLQGEKNKTRDKSGQLKADRRLYISSDTTYFVLPNKASVFLQDNNNKKIQHMGE
ncbi:hypothetical protein ACJX0J_028503, partial [Zea mays]